MACLLSADAGRRCPRAALKVPPSRSARATATLVSDTDAVAAGKPLPPRPAPSPRRRAGTPTGATPATPAWPPELTSPSPPAHRRPDRLAGAASACRGPADDLRLHRRGAARRSPSRPARRRRCTVRLHATWLVCANICVPEEGDFRLDLPHGTPAPSAQRPRSPRPRRGAAASPWPAEIAPGRHACGSPAPGSTPRRPPALVLPRPPGRSSTARPRRSTRRTARSPSEARPAGPDSARRHPRDRGDPAARAPLASAATSGRAAPVRPTARPLARRCWPLLGGLILNLMPCVFPILAHQGGRAGQPGRRRRGHAGATRSPTRRRGRDVPRAGAGAAGACASRRARAAGASSSSRPCSSRRWRWLLFAVGLNLSGVFAVGGPVGAGQDLAARGGHAGSFFTGLLAVLVATPCTAPFMGAAIAGGLAGSGCGDRGGVPGHGHRPGAALRAAGGDPRGRPRAAAPGRLDGVLQQVLAFPMYGAALWLVWVLSQEAGQAGVLAAGAGLVLLGFAGWALGLAQRSGRVAGARIGATLAAVAAVAVGCHGAAGCSALPRRRRRGPRARSRSRTPGWRRCGRRERRCSST